MDTKICQDFVIVNKAAFLLSLHYLVVVNTSTIIFFAGYEKENGQVNSMCITDGHFGFLN